VMSRCNCYGIEHCRCDSPGVVSRVASRPASFLARGFPKPEIDSITFCLSFARDGYLVLILGVL